ncbi:hypothetical protein [Colwellia sp. KU-HH00111]
MKNRRQISATARRNHLKMRHHKVNTRRQFFYNQIAHQAGSQTTTQAS